MAVSIIEAKSLKCLRTAYTREKTRLGVSLNFAVSGVDNSSLLKEKQQKS